MTAREILEEMGWKYVTGNLWSHKEHFIYGMIPVDPDGTAQDVMHALVNTGQWLKINQIRDALDLPKK